MREPRFRSAVYAGSFDPFTKGHENVVYRAASMFDKILIVVAQNSRKHTMFTAEERKALIEASLTDREFFEVHILPEDMSVASFANHQGCTAMIKGIRNSTDFEYEQNMSQINNGISSMVQTVLLFADPYNLAVSSSASKELVRLGENVDRYVWPHVREAIEQKLI